MKTIGYSLLVILISSANAVAQLKIIGNVVEHSTQAGLAGVEIREKLSGKAFITPAAGKFNLIYQADSIVLEFKKNGYKSWEVKLKNWKKFRSYTTYGLKIGLLKPGEKIDVSEPDTLSIFPYDMIPIQTVVSGVNKKNESREMIYALDTLTLQPETCSKCFHFEMQGALFYVSQEELINEFRTLLLKSTDDYSRQGADSMLNYLTSQVADTAIIDKGKLQMLLGDPLQYFVFKKMDQGSINIYDKQKNRIEYLVRETIFVKYSFAAWGGYVYYLKDKIVLERTMIRMG